MKTKFKIRVLAIMAALFTCLDRLFRSPHAVALPNALGLFGEKTETLYLDPASTYNSGNPWPGPSTTATRFLLVQRGATGGIYADLCAGGNGGSLPLGVTPDAPYNSGDPFAVWRFGAHPGIWLGVTSTAITIDHLVYSAALGRVADLTLAGNGTYWVVGRALTTVAANADLGEIPFAPCTPYQVTVSNGGGTYAYTLPGV